MTRITQRMAPRLVPRLAIKAALLGALLSPATLFALGLGEIHPNSALSQPFDAEIELVNPTADELGSLKVGVAGSDIYARFGLDRPAFLSTFVFKIVPTGDGRAIVRVTSTRAVTEPVVTMLVEANWAGGRTIHEYTVFLDPPVFMPVQPAPSTQVAREEPQPATPPTDESRASGVIERAPEPTAAPPPVARTPEPTTPAPEQTVTTTPAPPTSVPPPTEEIAQTPSPTQVAPTPTLTDESYEVQRRDSLWQIANRIRPGTPQMINQTMIALYRANPSAFVGSNINRLKSGVVLRIPTDDDLLSVDVREANAEVARQYNEWRPQAAETVADSGRLQLVTPTEPVQAPSAAEQAATAKAARDAEAAAAKSAADAKAKADADAKAAADAEAKRLLDLKNAELARMQREREQQAAAEAEAARKAAEAQKAAVPPAPAAETPAVAAEPAPAPVETPPVAQTQPKPVPAAIPEAAEPSLMDKLGELPWTSILIGLGALLVGGGAIAYSRRRQPQSMSFPMPDSGGGVATMTPADFEAALDRGSSRGRAASSEESAFDDPRTLQVEALSEDVEATKPLRMSEPTSELPRTPLRNDDTMSSETAIHVDQQDALAEADFHMAYGLYDQAADLIKIAIQREPQRRDLKFKLLEIFFVWGNKDSFVEAARDLYQTRDVAPAGEWDRILVMGKQIAAENPMFKGGAANLGDMIDVNLEGGENRVDIDLFAAPEGGDAGNNLDFEVGNTGSRSKPGNLDFLLDETANRKPPVDLDDTREMDSNARTQETPTIESPMLEATAERPMDRSLGRVSEQTIRERTIGLSFDKDNNLAPATDQTAELSIDDLGLDVGGLESTGSLDQTAGLSDQIGDDDLTRIAQVPTMRPPRPSSLEPTMEVPAMGHDQAAKRGNGHANGDDGEDEGVSTIYLEQIANDAGEFVDTLGPNSSDTAMLGPEDLDIDLAKLGEASRTADEDTIRRRARLQSGNEPTAEMPMHRPGADMSPTVEQPRPRIDRAELVATTQLPEMEPVTMSEVGTKLDLARAYMDMGDPDGARSILEEVLGEGNSGQRAEAQRLLDSIR